jgi:hypothetical protein
VTRQLSPEPRFDEAKLGVIASTVRSEDLLVPFSDDREAPAFGRVDRPLEIYGLPRVDHETVAGHAVSVDGDVGDRAEGAVISKPELVDSSWSREDVP